MTLKQFGEKIKGDTRRASLGLIRPAEDARCVTEDGTRSANPIARSWTEKSHQMPTRSTTAAVRSYARNSKGRLLDDTTPLLLAIRGNKLVAALNSRDVNALFGLAETAVAGYGADALALVTEGVVPMVRENPLTGRPWERGEAERLRLDNEGVDKGWVSEVQITTLAVRGGTTSDEAWPFRLDSALLSWGQEPLGITLSGVDRVLTACLEAPLMDPARVPDPGDHFAGDAQNGPFYELDYGRVTLDIGCTRILANQLLGRGGASLIVDSEERAEYLISEGLSSWQVEVWRSPVEEETVGSDG